MKRILKALLRLWQADLAPTRVLLRDSVRPRVLLQYGNEGCNEDFLLDVLALEWGLKYQLVDDLYTVVLPRGWYTKSDVTGTRNCVTIYDRQRRPRGQMLNQFSSRVPHLYVTCRYHMDVVYSPEFEDKLAFKVMDEATGERLLLTMSINMGPDANILEEGVRTWLQTSFPAYRNPFAYWGNHESRRVPAQATPSHGQDPVRAM